VSYHGTKELTAYLGGLSIAPLGFGTVPTKEGYDFHKECEAVFGPRRVGMRSSRAISSLPSYPPALACLNPRATHKAP
jgi:hypothetical protein